METLLRKQTATESGLYYEFPVGNECSFGRGLDENKKAKWSQEMKSKRWTNLVVILTKTRKRKIFLEEHILLS